MAFSNVIPIPHPITLIESMFHRKKKAMMTPMIRRTAILAFLMLLMSVMAETASAQFPRFNRRLFGTVPIENLARLEAVEKSVGITDEQKKSIAELNAKRITEQMELFQSANGNFDTIHKGILKMNDDYFAKLMKVLDEKQQKRAKEIYCQVNNGMVLLDAPFAKSLKITDEQTRKLQTEYDDSRRKSFESFQALQGKSDDERLKAQSEMVESRDKNMLALLTDDQRKDFEKAKGEKLDVDLDKLPPFGQ